MGLHLLQALHRGLSRWPLVVRAIMLTRIPSNIAAEIRVRTAEQILYWPLGTAGHPKGNLAA